MINTPAFQLIEAAAGKKPPYILSDISGISDKTLRQNKFSSKTKNRLLEGMESYAREQISREGYDEDQVEQIISNWPRSPYAGIIYEYQVLEPPEVEFPLTIELAKKIDNLSINLNNARIEDNIDEFKRVLLSSEFNSPQYFSNGDSATSKGSQIIESFKQSLDWDGTAELLMVLTINALLSLMAHWDVEFYCKRFSKFETRSLFSLLLPKLDPSVKAINDHEFQRKRGMYWLPNKRLLDLISCFGMYSKNGYFPSCLPAVSDDLFWRNETEQSLVNWRDGTKRFTHRDFSRVWKNVCLDPANLVPIPAMNPLYVAAKFWEIHFDRKKTEKSILLVGEWYQQWWKSHLTKMASDPELQIGGEDRWPDCLDSI